MSAPADVAGNARLVVNQAGQAPPVPDIGRPRDLHRTLPGYEVTPLHRLDHLARLLGVGTLWVKDESVRLGLPSFKILGGAWAVHRLVMRLADRPLTGAGLDTLRAAARDVGRVTLTTATDGNHGRGVARMAKLLGFDAVVYVPDGTAQARIAGIASEGATVVVHPGNYDDAVARAAADGDANGWHVVADVAYGDYVEVPQWVMDGYDTIFAECAEQLPGPPGVVVVQAGVGALAGATIRHYLRSRAAPPAVALVEPLSAACLLASAQAGEAVTIDAGHESIMAGLNCGTPSTIAWPFVAAATSVFLGIPDERAREAMRLLAAAGIVAGESGAAGLGGLLEAVEHDDARAALGLDADKSVLVVNTEGATDPAAYETIVGRPAEDVLATAP